PSLSGRDPLGHILFLKHERPELYARTAVFLEPVDWLGLKLTGRAAATSASATLHWVTDTRDLSRLDYDEGLLRLAGLERAKLPELLPASAPLGKTTVAAAADLGIAADLPVVAGSPDTMSAAVGSGAVDDHAGHLYVGTSSWISCHVPNKRTDPLHSIASLPAALPGRYIVSCEQQTAGASIERLRSALFPTQRERAGDTTSASDADAAAHATEVEVGYERLEQLAAAAPPGAGGVIFTPWLNGERTPVDDHLVRGGLFNLSLGTSQEQVARAVFEGVALNARWMARYVDRFGKRTLTPLAFIGGGARSALWCQIMADVLGREIHQIADPVLAGVRGAALLAGLSLGELGRDELHGRAQVAAVYRPDPATVATYDELSTAFVSIYKANKGLYARLNRGAAGALGQETG
ncbi:MAG TPA: FGGY-family carbohydrate kinase, partial [Thermoleophilaceae bacterium]